MEKERRKKEGKGDGKRKEEKEHGVRNGGKIHFRLEAQRFPRGLLNFNSIPLFIHIGVAVATPNT